MSEALRKIDIDWARAAEAVAPETAPSVPKPLDLADFLELKFPPREFFVAPIIPRQGLAMLYARTGVGKTLLALTIAYAAASGAAVFPNAPDDGPHWRADKPVKTIYIDAELPGVVLKERLASIALGFRTEPPPGFFRVINPDNPDFQDAPMPDIGTPAGREMIEAWIGDADFVVLDNLSALARVGDELDSRDWAVAQDWLLRLRRRGKSVLFVHHAGKGGDQRGTSRREDVLDTSIKLVRPDGYTPDDGAAFELHFAKARHLYGKAAEPFELSLHMHDGAAKWSVKAKVDHDLQAVRELTDAGKSCREIATETGLSKSAVNRLQAKLKGAGHG